MKRRLVAEWEPAIGVMVAWPLGIPHGLLIEYAKDTTVYLLVANDEVADEARAKLAAWGVAEDRVRGAKLVAQAFNQGFPAHEEDFLAVDDVDEDVPSKQRAQALLAHIDRLREDPETPRRVHTQTRMIMENLDMVAEIH